MRRRPLIVLGAAVVLTAAATFWYLSRPTLDPAREHSLRTAVEHHLEQHHWRGSLQGGDSRWFCASTVIEADEGRENTKAGIDTACQEFVAVNGELRTGSGEWVPRLVTVTSPPEPVEVLRVENAPDGAGNAAWIKAKFSWLGVKKLHHSQRSQDLTNATAAKARNAFGLPADAPVRR